MIQHITRSQWKTGKGWHKLEGCELCTAFSAAQLENFKKSLKYLIRTMYEIGRLGRAKNFKSALVELEKRAIEKARKSKGNK
jgi:hypothetical protein